MEKQVSQSGIGESYHTPKYLQVSHMALFSELPATSNQEFRQNLGNVVVSFLKTYIVFHKLTKPCLLVALHLNGETKIC